MLAKFIDQNRVKRQGNRTILYRNGRQIINPRDEDFIIDGYKELIESEPPECTENQYVIPYYENTDSSIIQHWQIAESVPDGQVF